MLELSERVFREDDFTMKLYNAGVVGLPFRMVLNGVGALRFHGFYGLVRDRHSKDEKVMGLTLGLYSQLLHVILLPLFFPIIVHGMLSCRKDPIGSGILVLCLFALYMVTVFSNQQRHLLLVFMFYPVFVAFSECYRLSKTRRLLFGASMLTVMPFIYGVNLLFTIQRMGQY
jgi:hypothetical protein